MLATLPVAVMALEAARLGIKKTFDTIDVWVGEVYVYFTSLYNILGSWELFDCMNSVYIFTRCRYPSLGQGSLARG
jgi:hypothetical protein